MSSTSHYGVALYMELRKGGETQEMLFIPELPTPESSSGNRPQPMRLISRIVSARAPRRQYRQLVSGAIPAADRPIDPSTQRIKPTLDVKQGIETAVKSLTNFAGGTSFLEVLKNAKAQGYVLYKEPIFVEIALMEVSKITGTGADERVGTPQGTFRRIDTVRTELGFSAERWDENA